MIPEYAQYLPRIKAALSPLGAVMVKDEDVQAFFLTKDKHTIIYEGDYIMRQGYDFSIEGGLLPKNVSLRIIAESYEEIAGENLGPLTLTNALEFMVERWDFITTQHGQYLPIYDRINEAPLEWLSGGMPE